MTNVSQVEITGTQSGNEVPKETFLKRLNNQDKNNILAVQKAFEEAMREKKFKGGMLVVGGILTKPLPRKDIDIKVIIESGQKAEDYPNGHTFALKKFADLKDIAEALTERIPGLKISEELEPTIDEEFDNTSILKHDGTIKLEKEGTTPIEFLNTLGRSTDETIREQKQEFCVVARV